MSVTGTRGNYDFYVVFDNLQLGRTNYENMYLDQQDETVVCVENCSFKDMNESNATGGDSDSAIVIGPDAFNQLGQTMTILRLNQGFIDPSGDKGDYQDIRFDTPIGGSNMCNCSVALGDGMVDLLQGTVSNNSAGTAASVSGPIFFGGPQAGPNVDPSSNIGALNLLPAEIGMGVTGTTTYPGQAGLKLSVQCHGSHSGSVDIVALAGTSNTAVVLNSTPIGGSVQACH